MLKHKSKFLIVALLTILLFTTYCFAEEAVTTNVEENVVPISENVEEDTTTSDNINNTMTQEIISEDQYLVGTNITMDKLVDSNVYIIGKDVTISGRIAGNLVVMADNVTITKDAVVQSSAFIYAKTLQYDGAVYDLYGAVTETNFGKEALIGRDLRIAGNSVNLNGIIVRNAIIAAQNIKLPEATTATVTDETGAEQQTLNSIYGSLIYYSNSELTIPEGYVQTGVFFNNIANVGLTETNKVMNYIVIGLTFILFTLFVYGIIAFRKNKDEKCENKILPIIGTGILTFIILAIAGIAFLLVNIAVPIALLLLAILLFAVFIALPVLTIMIANIASQKLPLPKILLVIISSIIIWGLSLIPYFNIALQLFATIVLLGYIVLKVYGSKEKKVEEPKKEIVKEEKKEDK